MKPGSSSITTRIAVSIYLIFFALPLSVNSDDTPPPPVGFHWIDFDEINAHFLRPDQWTSSFSKGKLMGSLVLTQIKSKDYEKVNDNAPQTRFTVNVIANLTQTNYRLVSEQVKRFREDLERKSEVSVIEHQPIRQEGYTGELIVIEQSRGPLATVVDHRLYLAHDQRDWLVVISFQSDRRARNQLAALRKIMMTQFVLH